MNLFILDKMPNTAAIYNCDRHVVKIILEAVEMMGYAYNPGEFILPGFSHSRPHFNHPMSKWVRMSRQNFDWTFLHAMGLCHEYTYRYDKVHAYQKHVEWIGANMPINNLSNIGQTDNPRCFGKWSDIIEPTNDVIQDYRKYYMVAKRFATWKRRPIPEWYI